MVEAGESVRPFFASWYSLHGRRQTGYYLGHQIMCRLEEAMTLQEIAVLEPVEATLRPLVKSMAR